LRKNKSKKVLHKKIQDAVDALIKSVPCRMNKKLKLEIRLRKEQVKEWRKVQRTCLIVQKKRQKKRQLKAVLMTLVDQVNLKQ
jgi:hypothetical protein